MKHEYEAVILAAGRGSRLSEETDERPKAILPIGPRGAADQEETSFLRRQIELLRELGVERVVVVVGYRRDMIAAEVERWAPWVKLVVNPTPEIQTSGSLHSFQFASRSEHGVLDGTRQTLLMDADIVYHRDVLRRMLEAPAVTTTLVCDRFENSTEEVLVFGPREAPRFMGKGLTPELVMHEPCLGEATGIVKLAPEDHGLVRRTMAWLLGDPDADPTSLAFKGFGPAKRATEHEELTERLMRYGRVRALTFSGEELPFLEVDSPEEYALLRRELYPQILRMESA
ncbi:MAG: NTP transferase domain-containing protein [Myxococcales bacterium]|nr:NTP transferase domain-containing protein [Myxococcales bacterium]